MLIYIGIFFLLLYLTIHYDINRREAYKKFWYRFVLVLLILVAGLRWRLGSDTPVYMRQFFYETPFLKDLQIEDILAGLKPLWKILNSMIYTWFGRFYILQLIHAAVVNYLFFKYFKKHSNYIFFCILFYFFWLYFSLSMQIMKASFSIAICLFANDYLLDKKWIKSYFLYALAMMFHPQTALLLLMPFFLKLKFNFKGLLILLCCFVSGFAIQRFLGDYIFIIESIGDDTLMQKANGYAQIVSGANNSLLRTVTAIGILFCEILIVIYAKKRAKLNVSNLEPFLMLGMASLMIQINIELFYRYVFYFSFYFIILFSFIAQYIVQNRREIRKELAFARVLVFFSPLLLCIHVNRYFQLLRYVPYSSIIEKSVDKAREDNYIMNGKPAANKNEY